MDRADEIKSQLAIESLSDTRWCLIKSGAYNKAEASVAALFSVQRAARLGLSFLLAGGIAAICGMPAF
jgi:hypothetical protein